MVQIQLVNVFPIYDNFYVPCTYVNRTLIHEMLCVFLLIQYISYKDFNEHQQPAFAKTKTQISSAVTAQHRSAVQ